MSLMGLSLAPVFLVRTKSCFFPTQMPVRAYNGELSSINEYYQQLSVQYGEVIELKNRR